MKVSKASRRKKIHFRIRRKIKGTAQRPRLSVFRSNKEIYCQLIDDVSGTTLAAASSRDKDFDTSGSRVEQAKRVGQSLADRAKVIEVETALFDRSGYLYHGRVKALADGARENGIKL